MEPGPACKRRRPAVACTECRRRKVRCDRASPCGPCSKSGFRCRYHYHNNSSDRMQQEMFAQLGYGQSIMKPDLHDGLGDMDMLPMDMTYLNDDSSLGFIDYFALDAPHADNMPLYSAVSQIDNEAFRWAIKSSSTSKRPSSLVSSTPSTSDSIPTRAFGLGSSESDSLIIPSLGSVNSISAVGSTVSSSDSSPASRATADPKDDGERRWQDAFYRCKRLQFLANLVNRKHDTELSSSDAMVRSLMKTFTRLDRVTQRDWETQALLPHNNLGWPTTGVLPVSAGRSLLPPRETCDILFETYLNTFESVLRIVHIPSFQREYKRFWTNKASLSMEEDEAFSCKLMIILALGSCVCSSRHILDSSARRQGVSLRQQARGWIVHARNWVGSKIFAQADLDNVQTRCLLALARHTHQHTLPAGAVWFPGDQDLTRVGIQMGLHREPRVRFPNLSVKEAEIRRRLWATILELSLQVCFDEGLPAPLSPESYDCELPSNITDEELEVGSLKKPTSSEHMKFTPSMVQIQLARTQRLRLQILQQINAPGASPKAYEESHQLAAQLNALCCMGLDMLRSTKKATNFQIKLLDVFTRPFVLALHDPYADKATTNPAYYYSRKMRMEVSALLLANPLLAVPAPNTAQTSFDPGLDISGATLSNTYVRPPGIDACAAISTQGHGHFALVQRQATAALCLDLISELEEKSFPATDGAGWEKLRGTIRQAVLGYERRVRAAEGTHSTHEFLFFACAEAYIEALLRGYHSRDADEAIAEAARTALAVCCEVMKRQRRGSRAERLGDNEDDSHKWLISDHEDGISSDGEIC